MSEGILVAVVCVVVIGATVGICFVAWGRGNRRRIAILSARDKNAMLISGQVAAATHRALNRISTATGEHYGRTGSFFTLVVCDGGFSLVSGTSELRTAAFFPRELVRDIRVGKTSWVYTDYTTLFFGIAAGGTVYDLPIRVNGPESASLMPATASQAEKWASDASAMMARDA